LVVRLDDATFANNESTLFADLAFLIEVGVAPLVVAPTVNAAHTLVRQMNRTGNSAVGLSGADAGMIPAAPGETVGAVQTRILRTLMSERYVPVIEPLALGLGGNDVAVGADEIASALARAISATRAIFFHGTGGVPDAHTQRLINELTPAEALELADRDDLPADLRAAIRAAAHGVRGGVEAAQIVDGRIAHATIVEFLTAKHLGTQVAGTVFTS
jgi:acetylglutamate kinase